MNMTPIEITNFGAVVQCPYNKSHTILAHRFAKHLIKCRRQHPNAKIAICPFNSSHHVNEQEMKVHTTTCPDQGQIKSFMYPIGCPANPSMDSTLIPSDQGVTGGLMYNTLVPSDQSVAAGLIDSTMVASGTGIPDEAAHCSTSNSLCEEENWDDMDEPPYNPQEYCERNLIIRKATQKTKSQRRQFREAERKRFEILKNRDAFPQNRET
uniref:CHHC U11-48K-type domain-containing protein n=1 Tax=Anopheles melas TaxID=34690 RepID=A0A182TKT6_9DIPT